MILSRRAFFSILALLAFSGTASAQCFTPRNSGEIELALEKLKVLGSVLYVAAHPDDENSALLAYFSKEQHLRTGYLALNRGEGGQNLIGSEKGVPLGIIRTAELLAARHIDGAEQLFTRAYDFGYSKSLEETLRQWNREEILGDVVWAIRKFRPDIIVDRFPITGEGKHGHHTASGVLSEEAFSAAADPARFKEQLAFVQPWQARTLYLNNVPAKWDPKFTPEGKIALDIGGFNPELGKSYGEMAADSRNNHKSQGFGTAAEAGPRLEYFSWRMGEKPTSAPFNQNNFLLSKIRGTTKLEKEIESTIQAYRNHEPSSKLIEAMLRVRAHLSEIPDEGWRRIKTEEVDRLLLDLSGIKLEALADAASAVPGESIAVELRMLRQRDSLLSFCGAESTWSDRSGPGETKTNEWISISKKTKVPRDAAPSNQYWLERPMAGAEFTIADQSLVGKPFSSAPLSAEFTLCGDEEKIRWNCPVMRKTLDQQDGDRYEEVSIVPPAVMNFELGAMFIPEGSSSKVQFSARSAKAGLSGTVTLEAPEGWKVEPNQFSASFPDRDAPLQFSAFVTPGKESKNGVLRASFSGPENLRSSFAGFTISYRHIEPHSYLQPAELALSTAKVEIPKLRLGYIMGAGDDIVPALQSLGYTPEVLGDELLLHGDLSHIDTIVTGVRALNTRKAWPMFYPRLMEFVKHGGTLIVQYSANDWLNKVPEKIGPYPFELSSDRVTDENAAVRLLAPEHPLLKTPNTITGADFDGWVQERALWLAAKLDSHYETILEMNDPGEPAKNGALIATDYGKGHFIYTGLVFFRQLPAGNPGAFRLFLNLLNYGH